MLTPATSINSIELLLGGVHLTERLFNAIDFFATDAEDFGMVVFIVGLTMQGILGSAELAAGDMNSRFLRGNFWLRILFVSVIVVGYKALFYGFTRVVMQSALGDIAIQIKTFDPMYKLLIDLSGKLSEFTHATQQPGTGLIGDTTIKDFYEGLKQIMVSNAGLIGGAVSYGMILVMVLSAAATAVLVLAMAPICLPFAIHEETESIAMGYFRSWLLYCVLYLPLLSVAMNIAVTIADAVMTAQTDAILATTSPMTGVDPLETFLLPLIAPMIVIGVVRAATEAIKGVVR